MEIPGLRDSLAVFVTGSVSAMEKKSRVAAAWARCARERFGEGRELRWVEAGPRLAFSAGPRAGEGKWAACGGEGGGSAGVFSFFSSKSSFIFQMSF